MTDAERNELVEKCSEIEAKRFHLLNDAPLPFLAHAELIIEAIESLGYEIVKKPIEECNHPNDRLTEYDGSIMCFGCRTIWNPFMKDEQIPAHVRAFSEIMAMIAWEKAGRPKIQ